jgi:hypothetical protein
MHLIDPPKKVVQITHDILIGAHQKNSEVIGFLGIEGMEANTVTDILDIGEFGDFSFAVASDVNEGCVHGGFFIEAVKRCHRKKLATGPMIDEGLENGKIADVLFCHSTAERFQFFRGASSRFPAGYQFTANRPIKGIGIRLLFQGQVAEIEKVVGFLNFLLGIMIPFQRAGIMAIIEDRLKVADQRVSLGSGGDLGSHGSF